MQAVISHPRIKVCIIPKNTSTGGTSILIIVETSKPCSRMLKNLVIEKYRESVPIMLTEKK